MNSLTFDVTGLSLQEIEEIKLFVSFKKELTKKKGGVQAVQEKKIDLTRFSFKKARAMSRDYKGNLSEAVIEERRSYL